MQDFRVFRNKRRDRRLLEGAGGGDDVPGLYLSRRCFNGETGPADILFDGRHLDAGTDRCAEFFGIGDEVIGNALLVRKAIGVGGEFEAGKPVMPGWAIGNERVPAFRTPTFGNPATLEDQMRDAGLGQMLAHRHTGLPGADHEHVHFFNRHPYAPFAHIPALPSMPKTYRASYAAKWWGRSGGSKPMRFKDKRILVTGSTRGIGRAAAKAFAGEGARVIVHGRALEAAQKAASEVGAAAGLGFDVGTAAGCESLVSAAVAKLGGLDILINNAGIWYSARTEDFDEAAYDEMMDANVKSVFFCTRAALPELRRNKGNVVNLASESGVMGQYGAVVYCATKAAILNMTRAMALEYAPQIRVNCVSPGTVDTDMVRRDIARADDPEARLAAMADYAPLRRMAKPEEIAAGILYLASSEAAYVTGTSLSIDGGTTAGH